MPGALETDCTWGVSKYGTRWVRALRLVPKPCLRTHPGAPGLCFEFARPGIRDRSAKQSFAEMRSQAELGTEGTGQPVKDGPEGWTTRHLYATREHLAERSAKTIIKWRK